MAGYLVWLLFIAFGVLAFTIVQLKESRYRRLKQDYQMLEAAHSAMQDECKVVNLTGYNLREALSVQRGGRISSRRREAI